MPGTGPGMTHRSRMTSLITPPPWTLAGFNLGLRLALPVLPGMMAFGLAVGATAARKGLGFVDNLLMNLFVYAGMSQLVAMEAWPERFTLGALAGLAVLMVTINARMLLMSAALYPWLHASSPWQIYPALHVLTDPSWLIAMRYRADGGSDAGVFLGSSVLLAVVWMAAVCAGHVRRRADRRSAPLRHRSRHADVLRRHADPALAGRCGAPSRGWSLARWRSRFISSPADGGSSLRARSLAARPEASSMTPIESADFGLLAAIVAMAIATYAMRAAGFWMMQHVPPSGAHAQDAGGAAGLGDGRDRAADRRA